MNSIIFTGYERSGGLERVGGAYRIATVLRREGWSVEVVDFFYHWTLDELKQLIKIRNQKKKIDWIGFSTTWINYSSDQVHEKTIQFLEFIKEEYPDIVVIAGGQDPSTHYKIYDNVNYIISGFGEVAIIEVLKYIYSNGTIKGIPRKNGWFVDANAFYQAWPISDLSIEYTKEDFIFPNETLSLEISRGCKFSCAFCNFPVLGVKEDTTRDLDILETELKRNHDLYGVTNYQLADETLNDRDEKLAKLGKIVKNLDFKPNFNAFIRGDILFSRPQQLDLLAEARVWAHYYGIETFNHETGKIVGKGMNPDRVKEGLLNTRDYFLKQVGLYRGTISLIYGLPKESKESILAGLDWLCQNWTDQSVIVFPLTMYLHAKKSKIDNDYASYGYKIIGQENRDLNKVISLHSKDLAIWENEHMNVYDAIDLINHQHEKFRPGYFDSWKLFSLMSLTETIDEALLLGVENQYKQDIIFHRANELKSQYIQKKLGL